MKIIVLNKTEPAELAALELKKYITAMTLGSAIPELDFVSSLSCYAEEGIILASLSDLKLDVSDLSDPVLEDIIDINVKNASGYIAGSNPRSILMGVYKYCASLGVRYIRPGEDGDYIPEADPFNHTFVYRKKADKLFRGECCEGAISYEHMRDTVYWMPKIGMNMYMIEGLVPYTYMHKWYGHVWNTHLRKPGQITDYAMLEKYVARLEKDIKRTGIQLHTLGHAWMFEKLGIQHNPIFERQVSTLDDDQKSLLAEVNGVRGLYGNSSFYTHFCYSNPKARRLLVDYILEYAKEKPHVDFVHTWLADATNNQCECEKCRQREPSDWYVILLNEIDAALTEAGLDTRIVFAMYLDTVRPPVTERLNNPRRFVILSAIGQFYEDGYRNIEATAPIPPYERNKWREFTEAQRLLCHREWKRISGNVPSMVYEYRYYTDMYCDISQMQIVRETWRDMRALDDVDFNGCMSDQTHRMYMPTALPLITMGHTLFDRETDLEELTREYFLGAFGSDGCIVRDYLEELSQLLSPSSFRVGGKKDIDDNMLGSLAANKKPWINNPEVAERAEQIPALLDSFLPVINEHISSCADAAQGNSWFYLRYHSEIVRIHGKILYFGAKGELEKARAAFDSLVEYLSLHEMEFHPVFDLFLYLRTVSQKIGVPIPNYYG